LTARVNNGQGDVPVLLLLAPDSAGVNILEVATALRGRDRTDPVIFVLKPSR